MSGAQDPVGTLEVALQHALKLLGNAPALAIEQSEEILKQVPRHPLATLIAGVAKRKLGDLDGSLQILEPLAAAQPDWAPVHYELGVTFGDLGRGDAAVAALHHAVRLKPDIGDAWRLLGDHLSAMGEDAAADKAYASHIKTSTRDPRLLEPAAALVENRIAVAEALLREHLKRFPTDVAALRMLAEVGARLGRHADAETLLRRCLELSPSFTAARHNLATVLHRQNKTEQALSEIDALLSAEPRNPGYRNLKASALARVGEYAQAIDIYASVLKEYPKHPKVWMSYGHSLKTAGRQPECVDAYRRCIELAPELGEAYWSLANLKTFRFTAQEIEAMRTQLLRNDITDEDRLHFHFALGKALEDAEEHPASFENYAAGNRLRLKHTPYDAAETTRQVERHRAFFTPAFFAEHRGSGSPAADPIFIVGLPRAGSTLIEQILSSHSAIEGTMELPNMVEIARSLSGRKKRTDPSAYPEILATLDADQLRALGEKYLAETRIQRKTDRPYFIDKLPNNWLHAGMIQLILPNAKIIDARRHPLSCGFSAFKQHFARGQNFSYSLDDVGRYYRDYVTLMSHFDTVLPGRVHRVIYEQMVSDTESEVRRLLDYCGVAFEAACLRFYENERAVRTASSEQVRQPIYRDSVEQWRSYDAWLSPLRDALGPVLTAYPDIPPL